MRGKPFVLLSSQPAASFREDGALPFSADGDICIPGYSLFSFYSRLSLQLHQPPP